MPPGSDIYEACWPCGVFGARWAAYALEVFGRTGDSSAVAGWSLRVADGTAVLLIKLWRLRVRCAGNSLYLEATWRPAVGKTVVLRGLEGRHTEHDVVAAWRGVGLLRTMARSGRPALLSAEEKRLVMSHIIRQAELDGTPRDRLALVDAADALDELCEESQPVQIGGRSIVLPLPLADSALGTDEVTARRVERLRQWVEDILGHRRWAEARRLL